MWRPNAPTEDKEDEKTQALAAIRQEVSKRLHELSNCLPGSFRRQRQAPGKPVRCQAPVAHGERSQFALAKPGKHQRLVNQFPFGPSHSSRRRVSSRRTAVPSPFRLPRRIIIASASGRRRATSKSFTSSLSVSARRFRRGSAFASAFGTVAKGFDNNRRFLTHQLPNVMQASR